MLLEPLGDREYLLNAPGRTHGGPLAVVDAGLDALGDLDLALPGQQRDLAHLAQVDADRIVGGTLEVGARRRRLAQRPAQRRARLGVGGGGRGHGLGA